MMTLRVIKLRGVAPLPVVYTEPTQVTGLAVTDVSQTTVSLSWSAASTLIADTTQTFADGDTIWYTDPAAGGVPGIVCTTPGAGGTAVFRNMAALA